jgi:CheY-like chemotaxis protein
VVEEEYRLVVGVVEARILVVEELVEEQGQDMVEEQDMAEVLEQVLEFVVVWELLVIVDMVASMGHQLLA